MSAPENELGDTASSTHPPPANRPDNEHLPRGNEINQPNEVREELRRLFHEEFPMRDVNLHFVRRRSREVSPFTEAIRQHPIPTGFKLPNVDLYDGTSDPYEHVDHFRTIMHIQRAPDALLCQVFPITLKGQARTWFYSLSGGRINNFNELADLFNEQFVANRRIIKDSSHLSGIRQSDGESLKEYFQRFSTEARQIPGVDPELLRGIFLGGLRPGPFYSSLMRETVHSYADLIHRVEAQIAADEAISTHKKQFEPLVGKRKKNPVDDSQPPRQKEFESRRNTSLPPRPLQHDKRADKHYTPLNTPKVNVLMAIQDKQTLKWPLPLKPNSGNQDAFCHFHKSRGHDTEICFQLKDEIERLIKQGYLGQFVQDRVLHKEDGAPTGGQPTGRQPTQRQEPENHQFVGEIA